MRWHLQLNRGWEVWGRGCLAAPALGTPYQIQLVELVIRRGVGTRRAGPGAEQI